MGHSKVKKSPTGTKSYEDVAPMPALDKGWAWMIVLGAGMVWAILAGFWASYTLIYQEMLVRFGSTHTATALAQSVNGGMGMFSGPLAGALANRFGHRYVVIAGGLCCCAGLAMSAYAPTLSTMYFSYGIVTGVGFGLMITPTMGMIPLYFDKKRAVAMALSTITMGFASVIAPFVIWLISEYGYSGTLLIYGGIFLHVCLAGALYRPLKDNYHGGKLKAIHSFNDYKTEPGESKLLTQLNSFDNRLVSSLNNIPQREAKLAQIKATYLHRSMANIHFQLYYSNSSVSVTENKNCYSEHETESDEPTCACKNHFSAWFNVCDGALLKHKYYILFTISVTGIYFVNSIACNFLSGIASEKGLDKNDIRILLISINICDAVSRLVSGILLDCSFARKHFILIHTLTGIFASVSQAVIALSSNKILLTVAWNLYQCCFATHHAQQPNALSDILGPERVTSAVGMMRLINGIALVIGPLAGGSLKDLTNQYMWCYALSSSVGLLTSAIFLIYDQCHRKSKYWHGKSATTLATV